jgi:hypothetical protein
MVNNVALQNTFQLIELNKILTPSGVSFLKRRPKSEKISHLSCVIERLVSMEKALNAIFNGNFRLSIGVYNHQNGMFTLVASSQSKSINLSPLFSSDESFLKKAFNHFNSGKRTDFLDHNRNCIPISSFGAAPKFEYDNFYSILIKPVFDETGALLGVFAIEEKQQLAFVSHRKIFDNLSTEIILILKHFYEVFLII